MIPPAAPSGPVVSIRRFRRQQLTLQRLVDLGSVPSEISTLLRSVIERKHNVIIAGGSGSGKTSFLNALSSLASDDERVVVIEDSQELRIRLPHVVQLESQPSDVHGRGAVTIRDLLRATLRMRPDRIVIGEIRGGEALDLIQAMTSWSSGLPLHGSRHTSHRYAEPIGNDGAHDRHRGAAHRPPRSNRFGGGHDRPGFTWLRRLAVCDPCIARSSVTTEIAAIGSITCSSGRQTSEEANDGASNSNPLGRGRGRTDFGRSRPALESRASVCWVRSSGPGELAKRKPRPSQA